MSEIVEMVRHLLEREFELGEPWKAPKATGFAVPILGVPPFPDRGYVLLEEVKDEVEFKDSGSIGGVDAVNRGDKPVFVRKGTILKGQGTQSRSPVSGFVLEPTGEVVRIPVNCIHSSQPIRMNLNFVVGGQVPDSVSRRLGNQGATWSSINRYASASRSSAGVRAGGAAMTMAMAALSSLGTDNLAGVSETVEKFKLDVEDFLKHVPGDHIHQVGLAIFDLNGVVGVEVFDHPDSWRAFSKSIIRSYSEVLGAEAKSELYDIRMDKAEPVLMDFLKKAVDAGRNLITQNLVSKIWALTAEGVDGELAEVEGKEVHLILSRSEKPEERGEPLRTWAGRGPPRTQRSRETAGRPYALWTTAGPADVRRSANWLRKKGSLNLLQKLEEKPSRFTELLDDMKISRGTLATRLKEAENMGYVVRSLRQENGAVAYGLTGDGEKLEKKAVWLART